MNFNGIFKKFAAIVIFLTPIIIAEKVDANQSTFTQIAQFQSEDNPDELRERGAELLEQGKVSEGLDFLQRAEKKYEQLGRTDNQAYAYVQYTIIYFRWANGKSDSKENTIERIRLIGKSFEKSGNLIGQYNTHYLLANIYLQDENYVEALKEVNSARLIYNKGIGKILSTDTLFNLSIEGVTFMESLMRILSANVHYSLGDYVQSEKDVQESILLSSQSRSIDISYQHAAYILLGNIYRNFKGNETKAIEYYKAALEMLEASEIPNAAESKESLAESVQKSSNLPLLIQIYSELNLPLDIKKLSEEGAQNEEFGSLAVTQVSNTLALGDLLYNQGDYTSALNQYKIGLEYANTIKSRGSQRYFLSSIGDVYRHQGKPELAITFYKQAVNLTEEVRQDLKTLNVEQQKTYIKAVEETYRNLADLLLEQGRIWEAQRTLELLKGEEIYNYLQDTRASYVNGKLEYSQAESNIIQKYGSLIEFGQKLISCKHYCADLKAQKARLTEEYEQYTQSVITSIRNNRKADVVFNDPANLLSDTKKIVESQENTILIYPFVGKDRLWILWSTAGIINQIEVPVTHKILGDAVVKFRTLLEEGKRKPNNLAELQAVSNQLHGWLIKPIEPYLKEHKIKNIVFSTDRVTRYIPMAALYDGKEYLIQKYQLSNIITAKDTNTDPISMSAQKNRILAFGLSQGSKEDNQPALVNVETELESIVRSSGDESGIFPGERFLNSDFTLSALKARVPDYPILHLATHGKFSPSESYLLLGSNQPRKLTPSLIQKELNLNNLNLVVLSACETGLGGSDNRGTEIAGLNYAFTANNGAKSVLASLWKVDDQSTSELMTGFYQNLGNQKITKAESLQKAQISLLDGQFKHPYYWSSFILTGNRL